MNRGRNKQEAPLAPIYSEWMHHVVEAILLTDSGIGTVSNHSELSTPIDYDPKMNKYFLLQ